MRIAKQRAGRAAVRVRSELRWLVSKEERWQRLVEERRWVFVTGCNRSGKTTLSNLLGNLPEVAVVPNASWHSRALACSRREGCPHVWAEKLERFRLTEESSRQPLARLAFDWLRFTGLEHPVIVVESDLAAVRMRWFQEVFPDSRFVGMIRNGYAVAQAIRSKEAYSLERCARQWRISNHCMLGDSSLVKRFRLVRYEELVQEPFRVTQELCDSAGLDPEPLRAPIEQGWRLGNRDSRRSRLRNANEDLLAQLSPEDLEVCRLEAGEMLERLGYAAPVRAMA